MNRNCYDFGFVLGAGHRPRRRWVGDTDEMAVRAPPQRTGNPPRQALAWKRANFWRPGQRARARLFRALLFAWSVFI
jgi:hypothetical protein